MTVADLIRRLEAFDGKLPVCLADWYEGHATPSLEAAEDITLVRSDNHSTSVGPIVGNFVCIG